MRGEVGYEEGWMWVEGWIGEGGMGGTRVDGGRDGSCRVVNGKST